MGEPLPIYDLHRHCGGSIRPEIAWDLSKDLGIAKDLNHVYDMMTYRNDVGVRGFHRFLGKFDIFEQIKWTRKTVSDIFKAMVKDIRREGVKYTEIRFSIDKYLKHMNLKPRDIIGIIYNTVQNVAEHNGIDIKLVLSLKYGTNKEQQMEIANIIDDPDTAYMIDGIDCIGDESGMDADFYAPIYKRWRDAGKMCTMHAGESQGYENVKDAIEKVGVNRIGHGIRILEDDYTVDMAKEREVCFEISISSNWFTGVVDKLSDHPVREMFDRGLTIALCTDDPTIFGTTMNQELNIARMVLGFSDNEIEIMKNNAIKYAIKSDQK